MKKRIHLLIMPILLVCALLTGCKKQEQIIKATEEPAAEKSELQTEAGNTYYQSAPSYNSAFQTLIDNASSGDVIILRAGSHYVINPIVIPVGKNGITIRGESGAVIRKASNSAVVGILVWSDYNTIDRLELDGGTKPESGIMVYGGHNMFSNLNIHHCGNAGILLHMGAGPVCCLNRIEGSFIHDNAHVGISQSGHTDGTISWNQIWNNGYEGITVDNGSHNGDIIGNWIHHNNSACAVGGIGIDKANGTLIENNDINDNYCRSGITFQNNLGGSDGTRILNNRIKNNAGYGILERWTQYVNTNSWFAGNTITGNALGAHHIIP